jgi:hypothetical protein
VHTLCVLVLAVAQIVQYAVPDIIVPQTHIITDGNSTGCDISFVQVSDIGDPNSNGLTTAAGIVVMLLLQISLTVAIHVSSFELIHHHLHQHQL